VNRAERRAAITAEVSDAADEMMAVIIGEQLFDLLDRAALLSTFYDDRRPEWLRRRLARNAMIRRARSHGDVEFDHLWQQHLADVQALAEQVEQFQGLKAPARRRRTGLPSRTTRRTPRSTA
jgi:hypothetical protein